MGDTREPRGWLLRYTNLPVLIRMLTRKKLELVNPLRWEDRNDAYYLEQYKQRKELSAVLALCFTTRPETYHHWKIYAGDAAGVCIHFDALPLIQSLPIRNESPNESRLRSDFVEYRRIKEVKHSAPEIERWPFLKREPFSDEGEYRLVYESATYKGQVISYPISLSCITGIKLSPWLPAALSDDVKSIIRTIDGCSDLKIVRSQLIETPMWQSAIDAK